MQLLYEGVEAGAVELGPGAAATDCRGQPRGASKAVYTCANEIPVGEQDLGGEGQYREREGTSSASSASVAAKELVCANGQWLEEDPSAPWPEC